MNFEEESVAITVPLLAMSMVNTNADKFTGLTFGVSVISADLAPQVRRLPQTWFGHKFAFKASLIIIAASQLDMHVIQAANNQMRITQIAPHPREWSHACDSLLLVFFLFIFFLLPRFFSTRAL